MLSMQLSKRFVQQIVLDGFAFVGIRNNLLDCYRLFSFDCFIFRFCYLKTLHFSSPFPL